MTLPPVNHQKSENQIKQGKRSKHPRFDIMENADEYLAIWLLKLRNGGGSVPRAYRPTTTFPDKIQQQSESDEKFADAIPSLNIIKEEEEESEAAATSPAVNYLSSREKSHNTPEKSEELEAALPLLNSDEGDSAAAAVLSLNTALETADGEPPRKKKRVTKAPKSHLNGPFNHKCDICEKVFPTYQALGGHKASHRAKPTPVAPTTSTTDPSTGKIPIPNHTCGICYISFPSGQALGGHKRRHYEGQIGSGSGGGKRTGGKRIVLTKTISGGQSSSGKVVEPSNSTGVDSSSSVGGGSEERRTYLFDLNQLPPPEPEEPPDLKLKL